MASVTGKDNMIEMVGDKQVARALAHMRGASVRKIMRPAIRKGVSIATKEAKQNAKQHKRTGQLWRSIAGKTSTNKRKGKVTGMIYVRRGFEAEVDGKRVDPAKYAHLVEFGTRWAKPRSFMRKALGDKKVSIDKTITQEARINTLKEARKAAAKGRTL
jgi:HK97 gp10 family phage protein